MRCMIYLNTEINHPAHQGVRILTFDLENQDLDFTRTKSAHPDSFLLGWARANNCEVRHGFNLTPNDIEGLQAMFHLDKKQIKKLRKYNYAAGLYDKDDEWVAQAIFI